MPCFFFYLIRSSLPSSWKSYNPNTQMPIPFRKECLLNFIYRFVKFPSVVRSPKCTQPHPNYPPQSPITTPAFEFCFRLKKKKKKGLKQENSLVSIEPTKANSRHICIESHALITLPTLCHTLFSNSISWMSTRKDFS